MQEDKDEDRRNTGESEDKDESVYSIGDTAKFIGCILGSVVWFYIINQGRLRCSENIEYIHLTIRVYWISVGIAWVWDAGVMSDNKLVRRVQIALVFILFIIDMIIVRGSIPV